MRLSPAPSLPDPPILLAWPNVLALGHAYLTSAPLVTSAQPLLDHVSATVHESCSMAILDGDDILYVARSSSGTRIMSIDLSIGSRLPAFCTSMGRVLLGGLDAAALRAHLERLRATPYTHRTLVSRERLAGAIGEMEKRFLPPLREAASEIALLLG